MKQINTTQISIPKNALSTDSQIAYEALYEHFNGFDIDVEETENDYKLLLKKSDFTYCEDISKGLVRLDISPDSISDYCLIRANCCMCLSENWLPYGWRAISGQDIISKNTAIIHIDDHSDLMKPFLSLESGTYKNLLSNQTADSLSLDFLENAINTGAITIGSMLTTIVFSLQRFNIYHLKRNVEEKRLGVIKHSFSDSLIQNCERIGIDFINDCSNSMYFLTSSINDIISNLNGEEQCILHIDMDYFNNRYNGSTSWKIDNLGKDYSLDEQKNRIVEIAKGLQLINDKIPIKYVLIGISPSFYPSEYWEEGLCFLLKTLHKAGISVMPLLQNFGWNENDE